jgi:CIC family chloride channel protein
LDSTESPTVGEEPESRRLRVFYHSAREFLRDLPSAERRFWALVVTTGVASGLGAVLLVKLLAFVQQVVWPPGKSLLDAVLQASSGHRVAVLTLAGVLVTIVSLILKRPLAGHGTAGVIESIWVNAGRYSLSRAVTNGIMAIIVVGMGAPLGREGALIAFGAGMGAWLARVGKSSDDQSRILVACGAASGIAAAYNVPIGAALFGLEVFLGSFAMELLGPIVIACVTSTALSRLLTEAHPSYVIPYYRLASPSELLRFVLIAPIIGVAAALFIRVTEKGAEWGGRVPQRGAIWLPIGAMALTGVVAVWYPQVLGNGYDVVNQALLGEIGWKLLLILPLLKLFVMASCTGAGVPGGLFTPTLFVGGLLGGLIGNVVQTIGPVAAPNGAYALIGMAGLLAGTTHAAVSTVLIILEMTRDYGVILPIMLTTVIAAGVSRMLEPESIYTGVLKRRNVKLPERPRPQWLKETRVGTMMVQGAATVELAVHFEEVLIRLIELPPGIDLYVVSEEGKYRGAIVLDTLKGHLPDRTVLAFTVAADLMDPTLEPLGHDDPLSRAAERFTSTWLDKLPVVDTNGRLLGTISKQDIFRHGHF